MKAKIWTITALLAAWAPPVAAQAPPAQGLGAASLEDLMNMEVTSVSKKEQTLSNTPAAVYVISKEDIRRSGATNIPDLLRMAPGVEVAQIDTGEYAVSIRGFNSDFSNKVLVLIDGRSIYADSFSGVYWDQVRVPLADIERIEVIRGPGGTVWGANAVNGVINIITKSAADTKGVTVSVGGGSKETADEFVQYGADAGASGAYRIYARYSNVTNSLLPGGAHGADGWHSMQAGTRSDWSPTARDNVSVQADFLALAGGESELAVFTAPLGVAQVNVPVTNTSGDVMVRWTHKLKNQSEATLQVFDTDMYRQNVGLRVVNNTADVELEHHILIGSRHDIVWGADIRLYSDRITPTTSFALTLNPPSRTNPLFAAFFQDDIRLLPSLFLTLGSKLERNAYTGFEAEPSAQLLWKLNERHSIWAAAARAIRQPDQSDYAIQDNEGVAQIPGAGSALLLLSGNPALEAERMNDFEIGYRSQVTPKVSLDATGFLSFYDRLETIEPGSPFFTLSAGEPLLVIPMTERNSGRARDYGIEFFARWNVSRRWELSPGYSMLRMKTSVVAGSDDIYLSTVPGTSPHYQPQIRSLVNLRRNLEWDSSVKYVSALTYLAIPGYVRVDSRLGWKFGESAEFSLVGQNLSSGRHIEFFGFAGTYLPTEIARSVFATVTWRF